MNEEAAFCKRPSVKDDFLDLVNQSESLANQKKRSKKTAANDSGASTATGNAASTSESMDADALLDQHDRHITAVLSDIRECSFTDRQPVDAPVNIKPCPMGFPRAFHRDDAAMQSMATNTAAYSGASAGRKPSLFAMRMQKQRSDLAKSDNSTQPAPSSAASTKAPSRPVSRILTGTGVSAFAPDTAVRDISEENWRRLDSLPREEILREKQRLEDSIDPRLLAFFKQAAAATASQSQQQRQQPAAKQAKNPPKADASQTVPSESAALTPRLESEKLAWTRDPDLPPPNSSGSEASQARFDLAGKLVPPDADLPTHLGLHHHGDEPHRAGYSVPELFTLARSTVLQQRVLAFGVLTRALDRWHRAELAGQLQGCLPEQLLDSGLPFLCRVALDDSNAPLAGVEAALDCLRALLAPCADREEIRLGRLEVWTSAGNCRWQLRPDHRDANLDVNDRVDDLDDENGESDDELMRRDPCQGLLRTRLLARLARLLPSLGALSLTACAALLTRLVRHSRRAARLVADAPGGLSAALIDRCLSESSQSNNPAVAVWAFRLARALRLALPAPLDPPSCLLSADSRTALALVWPGLFAAEPLWFRAALCRNLNNSEAANRLIGQQAELAPEQLAQLIHRCIRDKNFVTIEAAAAALESVISSIGSLNESSAASVEALESVEAAVGMVWEIVAVWARSELLADGTRPTVGVAAALLRVRLLVLLARHSGNPARLHREATSTVGANLISDLLKRLTVLCSRYRSRSSVLLASRRCGKSARLAPLTSSRLPQLSSVAAFLPAEQADSGPAVVDVASVFDIASEDDESTGGDSWCAALLQLLLLSRLLVERLPDLLTNEDIELLSASLADLLSSGFELANHPIGSLCCGFIQLELRLLCEVAQLARRLPRTSTASPVPSAALLAFLAGSLPAGMELELQQLFDRLLFTPDFIDSIPDQDEAGQELKQRARDALATARSVYSSMISGGGPRIAGPLLPQDWVWLPLLSEAAVGDAADVDDRDDVVREAAAKWAALLDSRGLAPSACPAARLARLLAALSAAPAPTPLALRPLVAACCRRSFLATLDTEAAVPGVANFYDAWTEALRHYQGAGYGDAHFANALLIPCGLKQHVKYRRALWGEMSACLRVMPLSFDQLLVPLDHLLGDGERNLEMLRLYAQELLSGRVTCERSPVPYAMAIHHLSAFLYQRQPQDTPVAVEFRSLLWSHVLNLRRNSGLASHKIDQQNLLQAHLLLCDRCEPPLLRLHSGGLPSSRMQTVVECLGGRGDEACSLVADCIGTIVGH